MSLKSHTENLILILIISCIHSIEPQESPPEESNVIIPLDESDLLLRNTLNVSNNENMFKLNPEACIKVKASEGVYLLESNSNSNLICGLYLITKPEYLIEIEFLYFDVSCSKKGVLTIIDGWELSGQFFPGIEDHLKPRDARYHEYCGHVKPRRTYRMSQNVGSILYRIPSPGQGFAVRVKFIENPKPCNVLIDGFFGLYTLRNYGRRINCTATIINKIQIQIMSINVGQSYRTLSNHLSMRNYVVETGIIKKCKKRRMEDYVEFRGGHGLDPQLMTVTEDLCGFRSLTYKKRFNLLCPNTAIRLVSSGQYDNMIEFGYKLNYDSESCPFQ